MLDTGIEYDGLKLILSAHAYARLVERIYGQTTRDMTEPTRVLLKDATISASKPDFAVAGGAANREAPSCWLIYDLAGVTFAMPCHATYNAAHGHHLYAITVLTPIYKARKRSEKASGRKAPKRKNLRRGRGGKLRKARV